ncbi:MULTISPECIES: DNA polymerase III subunit delta [Rhizobium/Agrobacterium group]|uniref:DNA polymerase III subunit delta n=1 Tax=Rhizobium/Agrobacterium group TaxID=227290 RepID=UPI0006B8EDBE|nr:MULTISPECIES: DNA polymerase III subunit delta [Rhizobium/Agrobacterium group]KPF57695.1 DNA polymerase III subunit delta [Rhizobium sp. AAP116]QGG92572.1 DNA polymerase III subunit delta [Agrobacterium sp. MA01]
MVEVKSHEFEGFLAKSARHYRMFVIYGPDRGLVAERASQVAKTTGVDLNDGFALIRLDASDIQSDPGRLIDEVNAFGLFGGEKLIWVRGAANEKQLVDGLAHLAAHPPEGSYLLIEAGDLKKGSALRKVAEGERSIACIACYQDDARALNSLIDAELAAANLRITPAARELLLESIGGDRIASRNEIQKLVLYCMKDELIDENHVLEIVGDASAVSTDEVVDAVLSGDPDGFLHAVQKVIASKTAVFLVLQGTMKQMQLLETMRLEMEERQQQASQVMQTHGRGIHFKRKPIIEKALRNWNSSELARESARLNAAILQSRQNAQLEDNLAIQTLLATTLQSARRNRRA